MLSIISQQCCRMIKESVLQKTTIHGANNIPLMTRTSCKHLRRRCLSSISVVHLAKRNSNIQQPLTTNEAVLLNDIEANKDIDSLFQLLKLKRSALTTAHIGAAMSKLVQQQKLMCQDESSEVELRKYIREHPEFHGLCILAENKLKDMDNITLVNTLYALLKFVSNRPHSLAAEMITEVHRRLDTFTINELAIFGACSHPLLNPRSVLLGKVTDAFHKFIEEKPTHVQDVATLFRATVGLTTSKFRGKIYEQLLQLLHGCRSKVTTNDLRKILQSLAIVGDKPKILLEECITNLQSSIDKLTIWEMSVIYHSLENIEEYGFQLKNDIAKRMEDSLSSTTPNDLVRIIAVLATNASPQLKFRLEALAADAISQIPVYQLGYLCVSLRQMGFRVPSYLISEIANKIEQNQKNLSFSFLLKVVEFFQGTNLPHDASIFKFLEAKLTSLCYSAISPLRFLGIAYLLSLLPITDIDPRIINTLERMLPQYNAASISQLFLLLTRISKKIDKETYERLGIDSLLQKLNLQAVDKISDVTSVIYLNNMIHHILNEDPNSPLVSTVMSHYSHCLNRLTPQLAIECARNVTRTQFLQIPLLEAIADITSANMSRINPRQVLSLLSPFCTLNYQPKSTPDFFNACIRRFMPYLDHVPTLMLLDMAYLLSMVEIFPEKLLQKLFTLEFLVKLEDDVYANPRSKIHVYCQRLMQLNRAVVLECNTIQIPWFHDDYCLEMLKTKKMYIPKVKESLQSCLSEVLGGPQYFRSFVHTPYYYEIDFECVLESNERPLPCADYGSVLNRSGQVTRTMLSDLMQWGTQTKQLPQDSQRVAIDFLSKSQFCLNSRHPSGFTTVKRRHLELMGYKYIQIPYYAWDLMTLSEHRNELSYLQDLIFDKSTHMIEKTESQPLVDNNRNQDALILKLLHLLDKISH